MASKDFYVLVRANTTRVKIDDQWDTLAVTADSMVEKSRRTCLKLSHDPETDGTLTAVPI
jgi:hypothetical protein